MSEPSVFREEICMGSQSFVILLLIVSLWSSSLWLCVRYLEILFTIVWCIQLAWKQRWEDARGRGTRNRGQGGEVQRGFGSQKLKSQGGEGANLRFDEMLGNSPLFDIVRSHTHPLVLCSFWWTCKLFFMWIYQSMINSISLGTFSKLKSN